MNTVTSKNRGMALASADQHQARQLAQIREAARRNRETNPAYLHNRRLIRALEEGRVAA